MEIELNIVGINDGGFVDVTLNAVIDTTALKDDMETTVSFCLARVITRMTAPFKRIAHISVSNRTTGHIMSWSNINCNDVAELAVHVSYVIDELTPWIETDRDKRVRKGVKELCVNGASQESVVEFIDTMGYARWFAELWGGSIYSHSM